MHSLSNNTRPNSESFVSSTNKIVKSAFEWEFDNKVQLHKQKIIKFANSQISLDLIFKRYQVNMESVYSASGWTFRCSCPFDDHNDRSPSFGYNPGKNIFNCFGCHRGGGAVDFIFYKEKQSKTLIAKELLRAYEITESIEVFETFDREKLTEVLFEFADIVRLFKEENFESDALEYAKAITWNLDVYLRQHTADGSIIINDLIIRIFKLKEQLKAFGDL